MDFARHNLPNRGSVDLRIVVEHTLALLKTLATNSGVKLSFTPIGQPPFTAFIDESQIQQVLTNLIVNAIQAMPGGGEIKIELAKFRESAMVAGGFGSAVVVTITDQGTGMDDSTLDQIFEPFFTTKEIGKGTGLGLSIAHGIVEEHGGQIDVESKLGVGTIFRVVLPKTNKDGLARKS